MSKFQKKPVVIDAVRWNGETIGLTNGGYSVYSDEPRSGVGEVPECLEKPDWMPPCKIVTDSPLNTGEQVPNGDVWRCHDTLYIGTLEGTHRCPSGDWL